MANYACDITRFTPFLHFLVTKKASTGTGNDCFGTMKVCFCFYFYFYLTLNPFHITYNSQSLVQLLEKLVLHCCEDLAMRFILSSWFLSQLHIGSCALLLATQPNVAQAIQTSSPVPTSTPPPLPYRIDPRAILAIVSNAYIRLIVELC